MSIVPVQNVLPPSLRKQALLTWFRWIGLTAIVVLLGSCLSEQEIPFPGLLYSNEHMDGDYVLSNNVKPVKTARGCIRMYLGMVSLGEAGAGKLSADGGIQHIAWVDHEFFNVLGLFTSYCTIVYGE